MSKNNLDLSTLYDVPLRVSAVLGRTRMRLADVVRLGSGSVVELDRLAGEPLEILVNDKLIARGEAVIVNGKLGVRVTEIVTDATNPTERDLDRAG